jgi:two-component system chemotaxis response regulator CheY
MRSCLIVDDSRVVRKVAARIAGDMGFSIREAQDGDEAYAMCGESMPDAIILDWNMPVMSGLEFLEKLRQMDEGDHPKVIFCTTENDTPHLQRAMRAGANEYVMKPFDSEIMQNKFAQIGLLRTREHAEQLEA